jgi:hypothetical protein
LPTLPPWTFPAVRHFQAHTNRVIRIQFTSSHHTGSEDRFLTLLPLSKREEPGKQICEVPAADKGVCTPPVACWCRHSHEVGEQIRRMATAPGSSLLHEYLYPTRRQKPSGIAQRADVLVKNPNLQITRSCRTFVILVVARLQNKA